ncbi:MAG: TatD family hydrolase [Candidatus Omnitrophica bacterium]|nr:TatD family hydrolase [Candidatus Omnitrophota bacterium]HOX55021.1 TatD family hydrolase [Candidatus Omnitrophota bacterium]
MIELTDTHAHLDQIENLDSVLKRALEAGVKAIVAVSSDYNSCIRTLEISKNKIVRILPAFGIHPWEITKEETDKCLEFIKENYHKAVAIGEIGLDYWYKEVKKDKTKKELQQNLYRKQLSIAKEYDLPVIIHSRGAWQDCFTLCKEAGIKKAVFHWYSGPVDILKEIINNDYLVSATPALSYSPQHQDAIKNAPLDSLLIETDSPVFYRNQQGGFNSEPKDVTSTLELVSSIKNSEKTVVAEKTLQNAKKFFNLN